jgi:hypothetical protein
MVISNVQTTVDAQRTEWSKEPIAPGGCKVRVGYNAAGEGHFERIYYDHVQPKSVKTDQIMVGKHQRFSTRRIINQLIKTKKQLRS